MRYEDLPTEGNDYDNGNGDRDSYATVETHLGQYEATRRVNVRSDANLEAPVVRVLEAGDRVPVAAIESGWAKLADTPGAELVKAEFLEEES